VALPSRRCLALANCGVLGQVRQPRRSQYGVSSSPRVVALGDPVPKGGGPIVSEALYCGSGSMSGRGRHYREEGLASWYGDDFTAG